MEGEGIRVQCYSGYTYAEKPVSFIYQQKYYKVENIEREWREPGESHFLVRTGAQILFELCYNYKEDQWSSREIG